MQIQFLICMRNEKLYIYISPDNILPYIVGLFYSCTAHVLLSNRNISVYWQRIKVNKYNWEIRLSLYYSEMETAAVAV